MSDRLSAPVPDSVFPLAFRHARTGLLVVLPDGRFREVNPHVTTIFGYSHDELLTMSWQDVTHPEDKGGSADVVRRLLDGEIEAMAFEKRYLSKTGATIWAKVSTSLLRNDDGSPRFFVTNLHDITQQRADTAELEAYKHRLEELVADRTKQLEHTQRELTTKASEILDVSIPVLEIWDGILVVPLIGALDSQRTQLFMERVLQALVDTRSEVILIDITGVAIIDTHTAQSLLDTISAIRLIGSRAYLTGVSPAIARTVVQLGIELSHVETFSSLATGLHAAITAKGKV